MAGGWWLVVGWYLFKTNRAIEESQPTTSH
jgi:hypothetical protein